MSNSENLPKEITSRKYKVLLHGHIVTVRPGTMADIDQDRLSEALSDQPGYVAFYGELKAALLKEAEICKAALEEKLAEARIWVRNQQNAEQEAPKEKGTDKAAKKPKKQLSIPEVADYAILDPDVKQARTEYIEALGAYERARCWYDAAKDRGQTLYTMASIRKTEAFANDRVTEEALKQKRREKYGTVG